MSPLHRIWKDEAGFIVSTELVLIATILVIGMVVGLATVRNAVVQELGDVALAIGNLNHSYSYNGVTGCSAATVGSSFQDELDFCDAENGDDPAGTPPAGINVVVTPADEGVAIPGFTP